MLSTRPLLFQWEEHHLMSTFKIALKSVPKGFGIQVNWNVFIVFYKWAIK